MDDPARAGPRLVLLGRPGLLEALDQGNHAVVPRSGQARPRALRRRYRRSARRSRSAAGPARPAACSACARTPPRWLPRPPPGGGRSSVIAGPLADGQGLATSPSTCGAAWGRCTRGPTGSPVSAASGLVAALKMTFVHCGPRASSSACVRSPPSVSSPASRSDLAHRARASARTARTSESPGASYRTTPGATTAPAVTMLPRMTRGTSSAMTSSFPSPFCTLTTAGVGQRRPRARDRLPGVQRLGRHHAEVAGGQVAPVGPGPDRGGEVRCRVAPGPCPVTRSPIRLDRGHVLGPRVDRPHLDAGHPRQVRGVQAPDRPAADDGDPDLSGHRDGGHSEAEPVRAMSPQIDRARPADAEARRHLPVAADRQAAGRRRAPAGRPAPMQHRRAAPGGTGSAEPGPELAALAAEQRRRARHRLRDGYARRPGRRPSGPAGPDRRRGRPRPPPPAGPRRSASARTASQSARAQSSWAWRLAGGAAAMPRLSAGSTTRSPNRCSHRFWSSPCCPTYGICSA